jgi:hypothetical protein
MNKTTNAKVLYKKNFYTKFHDNRQTIYSQLLGDGETDGRTEVIYTQGDHFLLHK